MSIYNKLIAVQMELKAPKGQYNSFGKYKYRSCEDILEAVKPILAKNGITLTLQDTLEYIGERYYIKATATVTDVETGDRTEATAYAREEESKKGMDGSQITGTASSYARKYALNGLFLIDDTKDADTDEYKHQESRGEKKEIKKSPTVTKAQADELEAMIQRADVNKPVLLNRYGVADVSALPADVYKPLAEQLEIAIRKNEDRAAKTNEAEEAIA